MKQVFDETTIVNRVKFLSKIGCTFDYYSGSKSAKIVFENGQKEKYVVKSISKKVFTCSKMIAKQVRESKILDNLEIQNASYFQNQTALPEIKKLRVLNIDIKNAYPSVLKNLNILDKKTLGWLNSFPKLDKLATLGMLAKRKTVFKYRNGVVEEVISEQENTKNIFFYCVSKIDLLLQDLMLIGGESAIFYWVDGIYLFDDTPDDILQKIIDRIESENLEYHFDFCKDFQIKRYKNKLDIQFTKEESNKHFRFRDRTTEKTWGSFLKYLLNQNKN